MLFSLCSGSPFNIDIVDSSNVTVSGDGLSLVPVNRTASFQIHGSGGGKLDVEIIGKFFSPQVPSTLAVRNPENFKVILYNL